MGHQLAEALAAADGEPAVRAIVVTGAGLAFCAGLDMDTLAASTTRSPEDRARAAGDRTAALRVRKPLIAAVNGPAAGLGVVHALYCDVRFVASDAKLTTAFAPLGLPAESGLSWLLPRLVGHSRSLDLLLSGRVVLGEEAVAIGLADRAIDGAFVLEEATRYARELADGCSPTAMATITAQVRRDAHATFEESLARADRLMLEAFTRPDQLEGARSFQERRSPAFMPLGPLPNQFDP